MESWNDRVRSALRDRYELERLLGRGGSAHVFLAEDRRLGRLVAIKILRQELAVCTGAQRFLRELRVSACLQHPHIIPVYDSVNASGVLGYVMPYIRGETVADRIKRQKRLVFGEAVSIATAVAGALDCAHQCGVIHRDIKPANILLSAGHAYLFDFGISLLKTACTDGGRLTARGSCVGTSYYMSPEQASGQQVVDHRTDQYSLACVIYEMLAGRPPFVGSDRVVMAKHVTEPVMPVSTLRGEIVYPVCRAITRALAKAPEDRFDSAGEFIKQLRLCGRPHHRVPN